MEIVYNGKNQPVGKLVDSGNQIRAFDMTGRFLGYYDKNTDRTMNENNSLHSKGNSVRALIF